MNLQIHQFSDQSGPIFKRLDLGPGGRLRGGRQHGGGVCVLERQQGAGHPAELGGEHRRREEGHEICQGIYGCDVEFGGAPGGALWSGGPPSPSTTRFVPVGAWPLG